MKTLSELHDLDGKRC